METTSKASKAERRCLAFFAASVTLAMATLLNASTSTQVKTLDPLIVPRTGHAATALTDGRVLITGGRDSAGNIVAVSEIFDPTTNTSIASATLTTPRVDHTATLLANGRVLVAGGTGASGSVSSAEIFDPANPANGFRTLTASMGAARARHTATLLNDGTVLIAGGDAVGTAEIFDPVTETFSSALLNMAAARIGHTATLFSGDNVLFAGGNTNSMELFTAADQTFTLASQVMSAARTGHFALELSNTRLLFFDGDTGNTIDDYNSTTATITPNGALGAAASSATLLANGKILVLGANMAGLYAPDATPPFTAFDETSVPDSTALKRSGQTATELSGDKKIFVAGGKNAQNLFQGAALFNPARISTDKDDYQPDDPVILSGSGWKASEGVQLYAVDNATEQWTYGSTVPANANGEFVVSPFFIVELRHAGVQFHVTALGAQSAMQADVKFTDSIGSITFVTPTGFPAGGYTVTSGNTLSVPYAFTYATAGSTTSATYHVYLRNIGGGSTDYEITPAGGVTQTGLTNGTHPVGSAGSPITVSVPFNGSNLPSTVQNYNLKVTVDANNGSGSPSTTNTAGGALSPYVVVQAIPTTTAVTSSLNPSTYGQSVTFTATVSRASGSGAPTGSVNFAIAGIGTVPGTAGATTSTTATWTYTTSALNVAGSPHSVSASYAHTGPFADSSGSLSGGQVVNTTNATVVVTPYNVTYDGDPHTATFTITGVNGETGAAVGTVNVSNTTHTVVGTYNTDSWSFTGTANYNNIAATTITDTITKATPSFSNLTGNQTISCGTATISLAGQLSAGAGPTQAAPTGETATITLLTIPGGTPVASTTSSGFTGNAGNFNGTINTGALAGGTYTIRYRYTGGANFNAAPDDTSTTLTVSSCNQPPVAVCKNVTVSTDANSCTATVSASSFDGGSTDPDGDTLTFSASPAGPYPVGVNNVTVTADDGHGNTDTCNATVTVEDKTDPVITGCPTDITVNTGANATTCSATASWTPPSATDNCHLASLTPDHAPGSTFSLGTTQVTYTATDDSGNTAKCSFNVTVVDNTPPKPDVANLPDVTAQCSATVTAPTATDNCAGVITGTTSTPGPFGQGDFTVVWTFDDGHGNNSTQNQAVHVHDTIAPVITGCPTDFTVYTGPGATSCSATASWTPPSATDNCQLASFTPDHNPGDIFPLGTTTVTYTATDGVGHTSTCSFNVTVVDNTPPTITCPAGPITQNADPLVCSASVSFTATASDNCPGTSIAYDVAGTTITSPHTFPVGTTTVHAVATDASGNSADCSFSVKVNNPNPVPTMTGPPNGSVYAINTPVNFTATFTDAGGGTHTGTWSFDSITKAATIVEPSGATPGSANATYTFTAAGVYTVTLKIDDSCGGTGTATTKDGLPFLVIVYDPSAGFVTGGGWINSPLNAYLYDLTLTGKANFGFVSKYQKGATVPVGETEFQFHAASLNFHSTAYQWLVVSGAKGQYKGTGTINGSGNYGFLLTATDGQLNGGGGIDKFRIKIWDIASSAVIYDNARGSTEDIDTANPQAIAAGSIVIHK